MQLAQSIADNYYKHLAELSLHKQFHFCTRMAAWNGDKAALDHLRKLQPEFMPEPYTDAAMRKELEVILQAPPAVTANAQNLRDEYFQKYPELRGIDNALFRVRHLLAVYDVDTRHLLLDLVPAQKLLALKQVLLKDEPALRILSTYAVNFMYLLERVVLEHDDEASIDLEQLYEVGKHYDLGDRQQLQLYIYLYTHCIIGETNFYTRPIPKHLLPTYRRMLASLEEVLTDKFSEINLDNKLEFLVCCQIVGMQSPLSAKIYEECNKSLSSDGHFLVDTHNANAQSDRTDISASEHRNVLYVMSHSPYTPHATLAS